MCCFSINCGFSVVTILNTVKHVPFEVAQFDVEKKNDSA